MIPYYTFPEIQLGPLTIRTFGLMVGLGIVVGTWFFLRYARDHGLDRDALTRLAWAVVVWGLIGSRLLFVVTHWQEFAARPAAVFVVWEGGLQFSGAFLVAIFVVWRWTRKHPEISALVLTDAMVYGLVPGLILGRCGCYAVGEHLGGQTDFFLGVNYRGGETREGPIAEGTTIHNTALYELLALIPLFILLHVMRRRRVPDGYLTVTFFIWYGVQRFLTDFLRAYDRTVFGLTGAQVISIGLVVAGFVMLARIRRRTREVEAAVTVAG